MLSSASWVDIVVRMSVLILVSLVVLGVWGSGRVQVDGRSTV